MNTLPLLFRIKKEMQRKIALAQDSIMDELLKNMERPILHGGTAIWRCYIGKRFSEDIDVYLPRNIEKINMLFRSLEKRGFKIIRKKISNNSVYSELVFERCSVRLEATFQKKESIIVDYETVSGRFMSIYSLTPEQFIIEKIHTYLKRFRVRDLWDIFFLLHQVKHQEIIKKELRHLIKNYKKPQDEADLKVIILEGIVPTAQEMIQYIQQKWENENI